MIKVGQYCISVKRMNYVVCRNTPKEKADRKGQKVVQYPIIGYFNTMKEALIKIRGLTIRDGLMREAGDLDEAIRKIEKTDADFAALMERLFDGDKNEGSAGAAETAAEADLPGSGLHETADGDFDPSDEDDGIVDTEDEDDDDTDGNGDILVTVIGE